LGGGGERPPALGFAPRSGRAYQIYQTATGEPKRQAIRLILNLARPEALAWIPAFLADPEVAGAGMDVLDQLIFASVADPDSAEVEALLVQAEHHADEYVRQKADYIRRYLRDFNALDELQRAYYERHGHPGFPPDAPQSS
jgi:hypothetical protein